MLNVAGLAPLRFLNVSSELNNAIQTAFGGNVDLSVDALFGILADIYSITETDLWELSQGVYDSTNVVVAEGIMLDNLALLNGIVRFPPTRTSGILWIGGVEGTFVPAGSRYQSILGDYFVSISDANISATACIRADLYVDSVIQNEAYTLSVNDNVYYRAPTPSQTRDQILDYFETALLIDGAIIVTDVGSGTSRHLAIEKKVTTSTMEISGTSYFGFRNVVVPTLIEAEQTGNIPAAPNTITKFIPASSGGAVLPFVTNPEELLRGAGSESDEDLRLRVLGSYSDVAGGSSDSIHDAIERIANVESVKVVENTTEVVNSRGMPPKTFQVIVDQGSDQLIAKAIWESKPAGIQCYADPFSPLTTTVSVVDYNSQVHNIRFVRPDSQYVWVRCEYTLYNEEAFPLSGEDIMKEELAAYGQTLGIGQDVIPDRFYPAVYRHVKGVEDVELYFAITDDLNTEPVYPADYTQNVIVITDEETTNFSFVRVQTVKI